MSSALQSILITGVLSLLGTSLYADHPSSRVDFEKSRELLQEGIEAARDYRFSYSTYKFRAAKLELDSLSESRAKRELMEEIDQAIDAGSDYSRTRRERASSVEYHAEKSLEVLREIEFGRDRPDRPPFPDRGRSLRALVRQIDDVVRSAERYDFHAARDQVQDMIRVLENFERDQDLRAALGALETIDEKLSDHYLSSYEKINVTRDCAKVFKDKVMQSEAYEDETGEGLPIRSLGEALLKMREVVNFVRDENERRAIRLLRKIDRRLDEYRYDVDIQAAAKAVLVIIEKVEDHRLSYREKLDVTRDCASVFEQKIQVSLAYRRERGINYNGFPSVLLGVTELFSKSKFETRNLIVSGVDHFQALRIKALDDSVNVSELVVTFSNGQQERFTNIGLFENKSSYLELKTFKLTIRSIQVTGNSSNIFGTKGRLEVSGVR